MSITLNINRCGNFTSSEISKLLKEGKAKGTFGTPALTYIEEKNLERQLGRSLSVEFDNRVTSWGHLCESRVNELLGLKYSLQSNVTTDHPTIECWRGSCDFIVHGERIAELKCYQPKKFAQYTNALLKGEIEFLKSEFPDEYWQGISNAIINQVETVELISYMPMEWELDDIKQLAQEKVNEGLWQYKWVVDCEKQYMAYLPTHSKFRSLNRFEFEVSKADRDLLTSKVLEAQKLLI